MKPIFYDNKDLKEFIKNENKLNEDINSNRKEKVKVYCINCKYCKFHCDDIYSFIGYVCYHPDNTIITEDAIETIIEYPSIREHKLNKNNSCKNYKRKWWKFWI
jgi:hypothetical protein